MPPRLSWRNLIPGLIALTILVIVGIGVLTFAGVGKMRGETMRIHVLTDQARGVMAGSEVWLDGQKAGVVDHIGFRVPSSDTLHRVVISADVRVEASAGLRHDSRIHVRAGGSMIGPMVVFLESGTPAGRHVRDGDTLRALGQSETEVVMERAAAATKDLPPLAADAKRLMAQARSPSGTIGLFLTKGMPAEFARLRQQASAFRGGDATGDRARSISAFRRSAASAMARVDSVRALLAAPHTSYGRFRRDTSLRSAVAGLRAELDSLQRSIEESPGTLGRLRSDSALTRSVADARQEMTLLFEDLRRRPLRYINF